MHRYYLRISFLLCALLCIGLAPARAGDVIWDQYIGRGASADVLGGSRYDVQKMDVRLSGTLLSVDVYTNFAGYSGQHGITYGDLLLGHQWSPYGAAPYSGDDAKKTSTVWEYAFVLDNKRNNQGGQGTVYDLHDRQGNGNAYKKQFNYSTDRRNHIVSVKEEGRHGVTTALGTGQWSVEKDDYLSFVFDIAGTDLLRSGTQIALHWTMSCGNDVIEGVANMTAGIGSRVDAPATLGLVGCGVMIAMVLRRRPNYCDASGR